MSKIYLYLINFVQQKLESLLIIEYFLLFFYCSLMFSELFKIHFRSSSSFLLLLSFRESQTQGKMEIMISMFNTKKTKNFNEMYIIIADGKVRVDCEICSIIGRVSSRFKTSITVIKPPGVYFKI